MKAFTAIVATLVISAKAMNLDDLSDAVDSGDISREQEMNTLMAQYLASSASVANRLVDEIVDSDSDDEDDYEPMDDVEYIMDEESADEESEVEGSFVETD